ncbi:hypothetical protein B0H19DRAFT_1257941 [Mycena capillaripes]|nr:hypothetical protein B0H19DRAFT_1257941 [Mycena capillaripes]
MDTIDLAAFIHLGKLPTLEILHVAIPASISFDETPEKTMFSNLQNIEDLYGFIATHCSTECLQTPGPSIPASLPLYQLVILSIHVPTGFDLDDATIMEMASTWPYIEESEFKADVQHHPTQVTLLGLQAFSEQCAYLRKLRIAIDATAIPEPRRAPEPRLVAQESLVSLAVGQSPIDNAFAVARYLSSIFTNAKEAMPTYGDFDDAENCKRWVEVAAMLRYAALRCMRAEQEDDGNDDDGDEGENGPEDFEE